MQACRLQACLGIAASALACGGAPAPSTPPAPMGSVTYRKIAPLPSTVRVPDAPEEWRESPGRDTTAALVGVIIDFRGSAVQRASVLVTFKGRHVADTIDTAPSGQFALGPLPAGEVYIEIRASLMRREGLTRVLGYGRVDTVVVRVKPSETWWGDCVCKDGRSFGGQCCAPLTLETCDAGEVSGARSDTRRHPSAPAVGPARRGLG